VRLASADGRRTIDIDAPTGKDSQFHFHVPKPDWGIIEGRIGYLNLRNSAGRVQTAIMETMPKLNSTEGLILDLRGNHGGEGSGLLKIVASYLVSTAEPRVVVGQVVRWKDARKTDWMLATPLELDGLKDEARAGVSGLSDPGRKSLEEFLARVKPKWQPPAHRPTVTEGVLLARREAEPAIFPYNSPLFPKDTYYYDKPVVVLYDHRCFSAAELFLASMRRLPNVTLVGTPTTTSGGGSPASFTLDNSGLTIFVSATAFVRADGRLIDGIGIEPDVTAEPDVDYYLGAADRMLDKAVEVVDQNIVAHSRAGEPGRQ
jgi:C-terminal processing protease CtpA/Prc